MVSFNISTQSFADVGVAGHCYLVGEGDDITSVAAEFTKAYEPHLATLLEQYSFTGKTGQIAVVPGRSKDGVIVHALFVGIGSRDAKPHLILERMRRAVGVIVKAVKKYNISSLVLWYGDAKSAGVSVPELIKDLSTTFYIADYSFDTFKTSKKKSFELSCTYVVADDHKKEAERMVEVARVIGTSMNDAREWMNLPPNVLTPRTFEAHVKEMSSKRGLAFSSFGRDKALELGMGGFCAVDAGSAEDGRFIITEYKGGDKNSPTIALVGKGVTFDSGGISLKPSNAMSGMKFDMSGAAAVSAVMSIIAQIKPKLNVVSVTPMVENLPSGSCDKQDDILTFMNGKTAELVNTDAEGRLILADALCYAEKFYKPDIMIDVATLTGACVVALGHYFTGLMTRDEDLAGILEQTGNAVGDRVWRLPLDDDFQDALKSDVADLSNCGKRGFGGGTITAGLFLEHFVSKARWAHLDIAGTADEVPGISYFAPGSTGATIRLLTEFLLTHV